MNMRKDVKQAVGIASEDVVHGSDLDKQATTTKERISAYFTIAAAAFGLISDGCELLHESYKTPRCAQA